MGGVVDYSTTGLGRPIGPLVAGPIDAITAAIKQQQDDEEKRQLLQMRLDHEDRNTNRLIANDQNKDSYYRRKLDLQDKRDQGKTVLENSKRRAATEDQIRQAVGSGDTQLAQQLGARYQEVGPNGDIANGLPGFETRAHGGQQEPIPEGPQQDATDVANTAQFRASQTGGAAQQMYPDELTHALGGSTPGDQELGRAQSDADQFARAQAGDTPEHRAWAGAPDVVALHGMPLDQDQIRHAGGRAAVQDFDQSVNALQAAYNTALQSGDQQTASTYKRHLVNLGMLRPQVESGAIPLGKALAQASDPKMDLAAGKDATTLEAARINAGGRVAAAEAGAGARKAAKDEETGGVDPKVANALESQLQHFAAGHTITTDRNEESRLSTLMANSDKPVVQRAIASVLARGLAGEKGALSNQDIARLQNDLGGAWADVENWVSKKGTGQLAPEVLSGLTAGIQTVLGEKAQKRAAAEKAYEASFLRPTSNATRWNMGDYAKDRFEEMFGHPYAPQGAGGARPDPSNPDDPNAPDAGRPLDGDIGENRTGGFTREDLIREAQKRGLHP